MRRASDSWLSTWKKLGIGAKRRPKSTRAARRGKRHSRRLSAESLESRHLLAATVSGYVFEDLNLNGVREAGEPGLLGVQVSSATTNSTGFYEFTVQNSQFGVTVTPQAGWHVAPHFQGSLFMSGSGPITQHFGLTRQGPTAINQVDNMLDPIQIGNQLSPGFAEKHHDVIFNPIEFSAAKKSAFAIQYPNPGADIFRVSVDQRQFNNVSTLAPVGTLSLINSAGITVSSSGTGLVFSGTFAAVNQALANGIRLTPDGSQLGKRTILVSFHNETRASSTKDIFSHIELIGNSLGTRYNVSVPQSLEVTEADGNETFNGVDAPQITIVDQGSAAGKQFLVKVSTAGVVRVGSDIPNAQVPSQAIGGITLGTTAGLTIHEQRPSGIGTSKWFIYFQGTFEQVNAALNGMTYYPPAGTIGGAAEIGISVLATGGTRALDREIEINFGEIIVQNSPPDINIQTPITNTPLGLESLQTWQHDEDVPILIGNEAAFPFKAIFNITDPDLPYNPSFKSVALTVSTNTNGLLTFLQPAQPEAFEFVEGANGGTSFTVIGDPLVLVGALHRGLRYDPPANFSGPVTVTFTVNDQGNTGDTGPLTDTQSITLNIRGINDPAVISAPTDPIEARLNTAVQFSAAQGNGISVSDVDLGSGNMRVTLTVGSGTVRLTSLAGSGAAIVSGANNSSSLVLQGTQSEINAALDGLLVFTNVNFIGSTVLTIQARDAFSPNPTTTATVPIRVKLFPEDFDVFMLLDDTGSFQDEVQNLQADIPGLLSALSGALGSLDFLGLGVGRLEEYSNFAGDVATARPFLLNQPIVTLDTSGSLTAYQNAIIGALQRTAPGGGGDLPETVIEALRQVATGVGFDGNNDGDTTDSGAAGSTLAQNPNGTGDVPAYNSFTPQGAVLPPAALVEDGNLGRGGSGFRAGAIPIVVVATDEGTRYRPEAGGATPTILSPSGLPVPYSEFIANGAAQVPFGNGASATTALAQGARIQQTIAALQALGALVIGVGTDDAGRPMLEAISKATDAVNTSGQPIQQSGPGDPIAPGSPLYFEFDLGTSGSFSAAIGDAIRAAIGLNATYFGPQVTNVAISGPNTRDGNRTPTNGSYDVPTGSGEQIRTVPVAGANKISITFSQNVGFNQTAINNLQGSLSLFDREEAAPVTAAISGFTYNATTRTATWTFQEALQSGPLEIRLNAALVSNQFGEQLDGDWENPVNVSQGTFGLRHLATGSGDGTAGGDFRFQMTNLPVDFNNDNRVNGADLAIWQANYGLSNRSHNTGDMDGDGDVDGTEFLVWQREVGSAVGIGLTSMVAIGLATSPEVHVVDVTISGSNSTHAPYSVPTGAGEQLRRIPVGGADTINIQFSDEVLLDGDELSLMTANGLTAITLSYQGYDSQTQTATWQLTSGTLSSQQFVLTLSDEVTNVSGSPLDGEWINPTSLSQGSDGLADLAVNGSGDGLAGGAFKFYFTALAGDLNGDNDVDGSDYLGLQQNYGITNGALYSQGDSDGDGDVDTSDYYSWSSNYGKNFTLWPDQKGPQVVEVALRGPNTNDGVQGLVGIPTGSGEQIQTVPIAGANGVQIRFSEDVGYNSAALNALSASLSLINLYTEQNATPTISNFTYDAVTRTATWQFATALPVGPYELVLSDSITDAAGNSLDGEWLNPTTRTQGPGGGLKNLSMDGSGDGTVGGTFRFHFTYLPADFNHDNIVDSADLSIWLANSGSTAGTQSIGDANANGFVDGGDFLIWQQQVGYNLDDWTQDGVYGILVSTSADENDGNYSLGDLSLREALVIAAQLPGADQIHFRSNLASQPINLALGALTIDSDVTLAGLGQAQTTVSGQGASRVFVVTAGVTATLDKLTVTGGGNVTEGGGILNFGNLTLDEVAVVGNQSTVTGGGITSRNWTSGVASLHLVNSTVDNNRSMAGSGLAVYVNGGTMEIVGSTISNNRSLDGLSYSEAGGLRFEGASGTASIYNSTFSGNQALYSGGIRAWNTVMPLAIVNSTIVSNIGNEGGGIHNFGGQTITLHNTIVAQNKLHNQTASDITGQLHVSSSHNLLASGRGSVALTGSGNLVGTVANPINPKLGALVGNGGPTKTHAVLAGSPAIDAGDNAYVMPPLVDQRGAEFPRLVDGNVDTVDTVDMGAVEFPAAITVIVDTELDVVNANDGLTSLREALTLTNASPNADTITFDASLLGETIELANLELTISDAVTIDATMVTGGISIDAHRASRVFNITATVGDFTFAGLTMIGGKAVGSSTAWDTTKSGGVIRSVTSGTLTLDQSTVTGGITYGLAVHGGGIYAAGDVVLEESTVAGNFTSDNFSEGAGIYAMGSVTLQDSGISGNTTFGNYARGGGIFSYWGNVTLGGTYGSTVSGNETTGIHSGGGGIFTYGNVIANNGNVSGNSTAGDHSRGGGIVAYGNVTFDQGLMANNQTAGMHAFGGAVYANDITVNKVTISGNHTIGVAAYGGAIFGNGTVTITDSTVSNNYTTGNLSRGGGIYGNYGQNIVLNQSTLSGNSTAGSNAGGGAVYSYNGAITVRQSTITNNSAASSTSTGGGLHARQSTTTTITNSIIAGNTAGGTGADIKQGTGTLSVQYSLVGNNAGTTLNPSSPGTNLIGTAAVPLTPGLAPLGDYGGTTETHALLANSPARNAGSNSLAAQFEFDQRGFDRILGTNVDMGAIETPLLVTTAQDESDGNYSFGDLSLREALALASQTTGFDVIEFAASLAGNTITLQNSLDRLVITSAVEINGLGSSQLTINGGGSTNNQGVFLIETGVEATIRDLKISGGYAMPGPPGTVGPFAGGGIYNRGDLTLDHVLVTGNTSLTGGGIAQETAGASLVVQNSTISNNHGHSPGGAIYASAGTLDIHSSLIASNTSSAVTGGIYLYGSAALRMFNTTVSGNSNEALRAAGGTALIVNSTITNNTESTTIPAAYSAGGINGGSNVTLINSIVAGNTGGDIFGAVNNTSRFNLIGDGTSSGLTNGINGNKVGTTTVPLNARLTALGNFGGPTLTHALRSDSEAIDAGDNLAASEYALDFDQRGLSRISDWDLDIDERIDIGAVELAVLELYS